MVMNKRINAIRGEGKMPMSLQDALDLACGDVVSLVGAGGKSSLMYAIAREAAAGGRKVLTTTTTKIYPPKPAESPVTVLARDAAEVVKRAARLLADGNIHITAAAELLPRRGKLAGFPPATLARIHSAGLFDYIIVEADGAARRPLKACAPHEPVIPAFSRITVYLVGLDGVGCPLSEATVFRSDRFSGITGLSPGEPVTEEAVGTVMLRELSAAGISAPHTRKVAFLNKAESRSGRLAAERLTAFLLENGEGILDRVITASVKGEAEIFHCRELGSSGTEPV